MTFSVPIKTTQTNRKELSEAFGGNQSAVRRLESITQDVTGGIPGSIVDTNNLAAQALALAQALQAIAFVVATASSDAPNADVLTQGEGIKITVSAGEITISLVVPVSVTDGGTGVATLNPHGVLVGNGGGPVKVLSAGTAGQMLLSGGALDDPAMGNNPTITGGTIDGAPIGDTTPEAAAFTQITNGDASLMRTSVALADGTGSAAATLTNAPVAGNPTKWMQVNDNGTIRHVPAW